MKRKDREISSRNGREEDQNMAGDKIAQAKYYDLAMNTIPYDLT